MPALEAEILPCLVGQGKLSERSLASGRDTVQEPVERDNRNLAVSSVDGLLPIRGLGVADQHRCTSICGLCVLAAWSIRQREKCDWSLSDLPAAFTMREIYLTSFLTPVVLTARPMKPAKCKHQDHSPALLHIEMTHNLWAI